MPKPLQRWMANLSRLARTDRLLDRARAVQHALSRYLAPHASPPPPTGLTEGGAAHAPSIAPVPRTALPASSEGITLTGQHSAAGLTRSYLLYLPPMTDPQACPPASWPLVVMLHGCTQDPADFALGTGMNGLAREHGFAVLYPAQTPEAHPQRCWNWYKRDHQQRGRGEAEVLADMTRAVVGTYGLDARRVYVAGMSAGGAMASILGQAYPELYASVGIHSGLASGAASNLISALAIMKAGPKTPSPAPIASRHSTGDATSTAHAAGRVVGRPTIVFHGDNDTVVHPGNGVLALSVALAAPPGTAPQPAVEHGVSANGRHYTRTTYALGAEAAPQAEHWIVHGGVHAWSGGHAEGSYTDPSGPDASLAMWRFFMQHAHPAT